jgi:integrase
VSRHTCATTVLFGQQVDIKTVSNWLSHSSVKMTEHYTHNDIEKLMKIAKIIDTELEKGK